MKKAIAVLLAMFIALPFAFAARITTYGGYSGAVGDAVVGERGYVDIDNSNAPADVFACGYKDGTIVYYGQNLVNDVQRAIANSWLKNLDKRLFSVFDTFGCVRAKI